MASPHVVTSHTVTTAPQPSSHAEADKENINIPYTPTSTSTFEASSSRRPSPEHHKTSSLSIPRPATKIVSRSLSLRDSRAQPSTQRKAVELETKGKEKRESVMVTLPENLPPSPPLTSQDTDGDGDVDADVDTEEAVNGESLAEHEDDVTEGWRDGESVPRRSQELVEHDHPLSPSRAGYDGFSGDARAHTDLEKGLDPPELHERTQPPGKADGIDQPGATKAFEVIRRPKRTTSPKPPHSAYYIGPPSGTSAFLTDPCGQIGVHHPREIVRVERDYGHGELIQFSSAYPLELQGRITPTQFLETINALNEGFIRAHSLSSACLDNALAVLTLWLSTLVLNSRYEREMKQLKQLVDALNAELYNPQGLHILWPRKSAFLFLEIEYY